MSARRAPQAEAAAWEDACQALRQQRADARGAKAAARAALASAQSQQVVPGLLRGRLHMQPCLSCHHHQLRASHQGSRGRFGGTSSCMLHSYCDATYVCVLLTHFMAAHHSGETSRRPQQRHAEVSMCTTNGAAASAAADAWKALGGQQQQAGDRAARRPALRAEGSGTPATAEAPHVPAAAHGAAGRAQEAERAEAAARSAAVALRAALAAPDPPRPAHLRPQDPQEPPAAMYFQARPPRRAT